MQTDRLDVRPPAWAEPSIGEHINTADVPRHESPTTQLMRYLREEIRTWCMAARYTLVVFACSAV
jgi:hypothetical protein